MHSEVFWVILIFCQLQSTSQNQPCTRELRRKNPRLFKMYNKLLNTINVCNIVQHAQQVILNNFMICQL